MDTVKRYRQPGNIGGPMELGEEYRWNVPVVTYGFDPSFIDYFGSNGVAAVEAAIAILNSLPPASLINPSNYPPEVTRVNYRAESQSLYDLKSATLFLLFQHLGLAEPERFTFCLRDHLHTNGGFQDVVIQRNFDPFTYQAASYVNDTVFTYWIIHFTSVEQTDANEVAIDSYSPSVSAVAGGIFGIGYFHVGLSRDDVGGLRYLLETNNVNYETLLPGVHGVGTNSTSFVDGAFRPGVEKITFVPHPFDSLLNEFLPMTNQFTDAYITNNAVVQQQVERVNNQPDFLFCAGDTGTVFPANLFFFHTGTTNWINNAALNGEPTRGGPGLIQPPARLGFNKLGKLFSTSSESVGDDVVFEYEVRWGSFDGTTNPPIRYPVLQNDPVQSTARLWLTIGSSTNRANQKQHRFDWPVSGALGAQFGFQASTNLVNWISLGTFANDGSVFTYFHWYPASKHRFYRVVPE